MSCFITCQGPDQDQDQEVRGCTNSVLQTDLDLELGCMYRTMKDPRTLQLRKSATTGVTRRTEVESLNDLSRWPRE
jgi:hypothetical protein